MGTLNASSLPSVKRISYLEQDQNNISEGASPAMGVVDSTVESYYKILAEYKEAMETIVTSEALNTERAEEGGRMFSIQTRKTKRKKPALETSGYDGHLSFLEAIKDLPTSEQVNADRVHGGGRDLPPSGKTSRSSTHVWTH